MLRKDDEERYCLQCHKKLYRRRYNSGVLESNYSFHMRLFCNRLCYAKYKMKAEVKRSAISSRALKFRKDVCERCGVHNGTPKGKLAVHHINNNQYDNSPDNIMTLCNSCHAKWHWEHGKVRGKDLKPRKTDGYYLRYGHPPPTKVTVA